jgi:phosphoribosyl 1,2-cyclic phosphodiesterase
MNSIKFLGTAGARFAVTKQLRKSGGIWINIDETKILIDPGPGSLIACLNSKPKIDPKDLDGIILTHRHLDHSNDINIMIEAMTDGGWKKKGMIFAPSDAYNKDPVILDYVRKYVKRIIILKEKGSYLIGKIRFSTPVKNIHHGVECYGLNIYGKKISLSYISDTAYFIGIEKYYNEDVVILNTVRLNKSLNIEHFSIKDAEKLISKNRPRLTILTHFGLSVIKSKPWKIAERISEKYAVKVVAASDGTLIDLDNI